MADITLEMVFPPRCVVSYTPNVGAGEFGIVSSCNDAYVFVKFVNDLQENNDNWDAVTAKACYPRSLIRVI